MFQGWWIVATHFVVMFFATGFYTYALPLLVAPVIEDFESDAGTINWLFSIVMVLGAVVSPIAGPLVDGWSARGLLLIGTGCMVAAMVGLSIAQTDLQFVLVGGILYGVAGTLTGPMAGSAVVSRWFSARRGRALGIAAIGTSAGGMLIPLGLGLAIETIGWRAGLQALAAIVTFTAFPLLLFRFWDDPAVRGQQPEPAGAPGSAPPPISEAPATNREILTRPVFWLFSLSLSLFLACYMGTLANLGKFYADIDLDRLAVPPLMSGLAAGGVVGKLAFGYLADRVPLKLGLAAAIVATGTAIALLTLEPAYPILIVTSALLGVATGGILPVWNAMVAALFGVANFGRTMGLMAPAISVIGAPTFVIVGSVRDATGSYLPAFWGFIGVLAVALLLIAPIRVTSRTSPG